MVRVLGPLLIALACLYTAPAPAAAQGNCPQCDIPPHCRGNAARKRPECAAFNEDGNDDEDDGNPDEDDEDRDDDGDDDGDDEDDREDDDRDDDDRPVPPPSRDPPPAPPCIGRCEDLPRKCRVPEERVDLPPQVRNQCRPLEITVRSNIDFGRVVLIKQGSGSVLIDLATGEKLIEGDVEDIGGVAFAGQVRLTGTPFEPVQIGLPGSVGMRDGSAQQAVIRQFETDLPSYPMLDMHGELEFRFTGRLMLDSGTNASGTLRGRVPISVDYFD